MQAGKDGNLINRVIGELGELDRGCARPSFTAGETVTSPNSLTQQSVRDYFFVKLCIFYCLPFCIVVV